MARVVDVFMDHARDLARSAGVHVIVVAPPVEVFQLGDLPPSPQEPELDEAQDSKATWVPNFHDIFKARALELAVPCQIVRPDTYGGGSTRKRKLGGASSLQEPATRAWNFHTALFFKAGAVPWKLVQQRGALTTCYVGISFFKSLEGNRLLTSVAQVFNERGEGLIVQGGNARIDRDDLTAHVTRDDAKKLLADGLASYRREHKNMPARLVVHKTTYFDSDEVDGCREAASDERVELLDLVSVRRAGTRLFRAAVPPVQRGTSLFFDDRGGIIHLKGTVPYFRIYPGHYVPRALEFHRDYGETTVADIAGELLALSKLNFNNTQFDSGEPVTVSAARRVGDLLKHVEGKDFQSRFRFFT